MPTDRPADTPSLADLPASDQRAALERILLGEQVPEALQWLHDVGLLGRILPELTATIGFDQEIDRHHKDVWAHIKQVVAQSVPQAVVRWAALLHDIGKVPTRRVSPDGKVTFHGHPETSAAMFDRIAARLAFEPDDATRIRFLIRHHQRANEYDETWTDSAVRRFGREAGSHLDDLIALSRADITSALAHKREAAARQIDQLAARVAALRDLDGRKPPLPSGIGGALIAHLGLEPGPRIGQLKRALERRIEAGELQPHRDAEYYLEALNETDRRR